MSGLRSYRRDPAPLCAAGDETLLPPTEAELLDLTGEWLTRRDAPRPEAVSWEYARWKPATSLTAGYELVYGDGERRWVTWKGYADGKAGRLAGRREPGVAPEVADPWLREHAILCAGGGHLWAPPYDRELPGLQRAVELRRTKRLLLEQGLFPGRRVRSASSRADLLRYRPERRAVLRLDLRLRPLEGGPASAERLAVRALPPAEAARTILARTRWQVASGGGLAPRLVASEPRTGLLFEQWLEVEAYAPDTLAHAREAGALLARLHAVSAPASGRTPRRSLAALNPLFSCDAELARAARGLVRQVDLRSGPLRWTHGDFHPDQVARHRERGRHHLLDLDRLGPGDSLVDLASWVADHLALRPRSSLGDAAGDLLEGYASSGGELPDEGDLAAVAAEGLVHRAAATLRRLEHGAVAKAGRLLDLARELAPSGALFS